MIEPYTAVGLIPSFWGIRRREDIDKNLEHLESLTKAAFWLSNLDIPVRLVAIPEGAPPSAPAKHRASPIFARRLAGISLPRKFAGVAEIIDKALRSAGLLH